MRILIIGKNGNLGRELVKALHTHEVTAWDREEIDVTDKALAQQLITDLKPEVIYNCAAYTAVDKAESDYQTAELLNGHAAGYLAEICESIQATLIHYSTGMVFLGDDATGYDEGSKPDPINAYGKTKLLGETLIQEKCKNFYIIRTEWLYAKPENETAKKSFNEIMLDLATTNPVLQGVSDEIGRPTWAKDLAEASASLMTSGNSCGIYHITNAGQASRLAWTEEILRIKGIQIPVEPVSGNSFPRPAKRPQFELLNSTKLPPLRSWQEALNEYLQSKLVEIIHTSTQAEALMYKELLTNSGIEAVVKLPNNQQFIRAGYANAELPFSVWQVCVNEKDETRAREILPEQTNIATVDYKPKKVYKVYVALLLVVMGIMIFTGLISMVISIITEPNL